MNLLTQAWRFGVGFRAYAHAPYDPTAIEERVRAEIERRDARLIAHLDEFVWGKPSERPSSKPSPYKSLLTHAGLERDDVADLIERKGAEAALEILRDAGVYLSYEEATGAEPVRRGSATFDFARADLFNPAVRPDFMAGSGGTRSRGLATPVNFEHARRSQAVAIAHQRLWGWEGAPVAVWLPALPSGAGINSVLRHAGVRAGPERWFSQTAPLQAGVDLRKRVSNVTLPLAARLAGMPLPRVRHVPTSDPGPVLEWCRSALAGHGRAVIFSYVTSAVALSRAAQAEAVSLDGLVLSMSSEPLTPAKADAVRASGATPVNLYAASPEGPMGLSCPHLEGDEVHVFDQDLVLIDRERLRADGQPVRSLLWTTLAREAPRLLLNVENDDYGVAWRAAEGCPCFLGQLGMRTHLKAIRGMSKIVAGGTTVPGEWFEDLIDNVLPARFGGAPIDYQFAEIEDGDRTIVVLRVAPSVGPVDAQGMIATVDAALRSYEMGVLTMEVWEPGTIRVVQESPVAAPSGKTLAFETLRPDGAADRRNS